MKLDRTLARILAAFGAGISAWEAIVHASLLVNRQTPRLFGIRLSPRINLVQAIVPAVIGGILAVYALASRRPAPAV